MLASPAKRRRTSTTTSIAIDNGNANDHSRSNPTTPIRASYQSPTKASLARSHPHLIHRVSASNSAISRGQLLRNELLGAKRPESIETARSQELQEMGRHMQNPVANATVIDKASETQSSSVTNGNMAKAQIPTVRLPLTDRHSNVTRQEQLLHSGTQNDPTPFILPQLVKNGQVSKKTQSRPGSQEPELPPTPVQLGIDSVPHRPRGLGSSSSPRSSRSGSGRNRRSIGMLNTLTSSPLKPKDGRPIVQRSENNAVQREIADEAPESEADEVLEEASIELSQEMNEKSRLLAKLQEELRAVRNEIQGLEKAIFSNEGARSGIDDETIRLLSKSMPETQHQIRDLSSLNGRIESMPYLRLFAPGNLQLSVVTKPRKIQRRPKIMHSFVLTAPSSWPSHTFRVEFEVLIDTENAEVEKINRKKSGSSRHQSVAVHTELSKWIDDRLNSPLHQLDIGGLVWGIGRYFDECIRRARAFEALDRKFGNISSNQDGKAEKSNDKEQTLTLTKYFPYSQMDFHVETSSSSMIHLLLIWQIGLDWVGDVKSMIEVIPSGISDSAQMGVKQVFNSMIERKGVISAFEEVWELVRGENDSTVDGMNKPTSNITGTKKGKRKRF